MKIKLNAACTVCGGQCNFKSKVTLKKKKEVCLRVKRWKWAWQMCEDVCFPVSASLYYLLLILYMLGRKPQLCFVLLGLNGHCAVILSLDAF